MSIHISALLPDAATTDDSLSDLARGVTGSQILRIAAQIRAMKARGETICNLTVGDFDPTNFPIPAVLASALTEALAAGQTNYPPSDGVPALRQAIAAFVARTQGLEYPLEGILVAGGARPLLYGTYRTLLDPGDLVIYPVPSWNNNHYVYLSGARAMPLVVDAAADFFPTPDQLAPHLGEARMLILNSPCNPTGTVIRAEALAAICELIVAENRRRERDGRKALWLAFDQVYGRLTFSGVRHVTPPGVCPEVAPYTVLIDAISKSFAATGLRVGWALMPPAVRQRMADLIGHVGAWAPRAEQVATAALLNDAVAVESFEKTYHAGVGERLALLHDGFAAMRAAGLPVEPIAPQGAIYLSVRISLPGHSNEETRLLLLERAGFALVPFQAFGLREDSGWFRMSVGAVTPAEIRAAMPRVHAALAAAV